MAENKAGTGFALERTALDNRGLWGKLLFVGGRHEMLAMGARTFFTPFDVLCPFFLSFARGSWSLLLFLLLLTLFAPS